MKICMGSSGIIQYNLDIEAFANEYIRVYYYISRLNIPIRQD